MAEYVHHEENGLLFEHRDRLASANRCNDLRITLKLARRLGRRGYLQSEDGNVIDMTEHTLGIERIYENLLSGREEHTDG